MRTEVEAYGHGLAEKPEIVALTKVDAITNEERAEKLAALEAACGSKPIALSSVSHEGRETTLRALYGEIDQAKEEETPIEADDRWRPL